MAKLSIQRHNYFYGSYMKLSLWIDGKRVAKMHPGDTFKINITEGIHTVQTSYGFIYRSPKKKINIEEGKEYALYTAIKEDGLGTVRFGLYQLIDFNSFLVLQEYPYEPIDNRPVYQHPSFFESKGYLMLLLTLIVLPVITLWSNASENYLIFIALLALISFGINLAYMWPKRNKIKAINRFEHYIDFHAANFLMLLVLFFHAELNRPVNLVLIVSAVILYITFSIKHFHSEKKTDFPIG